jgi:hypothetical protein
MDNLSLVFSLLDSYARKRHGWFLAEMTPLDNRARYDLCFRPLSVNRGASASADCTYLHISAEDVRKISNSGVLDRAMTAMLDRELAHLT